MNEQTLLPEWAESLHGGYNRPPHDFGEWSVRVSVTITPLVQAANEMFMQIGQFYSNAVQDYMEAMGDATRDNAYHPEGPVIRSTAVVVPDNDHPIS